MRDYREKDSNFRRRTGEIRSIREIITIKIPFPEGKQENLGLYEGLSRKRFTFKIVTELVQFQFGADCYIKRVPVTF